MSGRTTYDGKPTVGSSSRTPVGTRLPGRDSTIAYVATRSVEQGRTTTRLTPEAPGYREPVTAVVVDGVTGNTPQNPDNLAQYQGGVQQAGINWLLPLLIIGGFFAATKLKKKKNVQSVK